MLVFCWHCLREMAPGPQVLEDDLNYSPPRCVPTCSICGGGLTDKLPHFVKEEDLWVLGG
jgi:hypothetical protein